MSFRRLSAARPVSRRPRLECLEARELFAADLRVVTYNVGNVQGSGYSTVLQAIGNEPVNGNVRQIDVLALQEVDTAQNATQTILNTLNSLYGAGTYARSTFSGGTVDGDTGGLIYRVSTVQLLGSVGVGTASTTGQPRQAIRYQLHPVGFASTADFYLYNSHYKASNTADDRARRLVEAQAIRANADALGQGVNVIYAGDFNTYTSSEAGYQHLLASGNGQAFDPISTPGSWSATSSFAAVHTQSPTTTATYPGQITGGMDDRFDFQLLSGELTDGTGLEYVSGSYHPFGNNGTTFNTDINAVGNTIWGAGHPLNATRSTILTALRTSSDHLPVVADYQILGGTPSVTFTAASQSAAEGVGTITVTAQLSQTTSQAVTVPFTLSGTAASGSDYTITASPITIPANQPSGTITITVSNDALDEANETVIVTMGTPTNATQGATTAHTATLTDDDPTPTVTFTSATSSASESVATRTITAQLSAASGLTVTVPFTLSGTATNGTDYTITTSPVTIPAGSTTATVTITAVNDTSPEPNETVIVTMGTPTNATQGATTAHTSTIVDDDTASTLRVTQFTPTQSGFRVLFNAAPDPSQLNLYDLLTTPAVEAADLVVTSAGARANGTLVRDPSDATAFTWVATGAAGAAAATSPFSGVLAPGTYSVTLRSASDGWANGVLGALDGDGNGTAGGDYAAAFTVNANRVVSVANFVLGPGQPLANDPSYPTYPVPIKLSEVSGVSSVTFDLVYNPNLLALGGGLTLTAAATAAGFTAGLSSLNPTFDTSNPNAYVARVVIAGPAPSAASGALALATLGVAVPTSARLLYGEKEVLDVANLAVNGGAIAAQDDDAVHLNAFLGDVNADGTISPSDASQLIRLFSANPATTAIDGYQVLDPLVMSDVNGDGQFLPNDCSLIVKEFTSPNTTPIPNVPSSFSVSATGPDPILFLGTALAANGKPANLGRLTPGQSVLLPVSVHVTERDGISLASADVALRYDPKAFAFAGVVAGDVAAGRLGGGAFSIASREVSPGLVRIAGRSPQGPDLAFGQTETVYYIRLTVRAAARAGVARVNLLAADGAFRTGLTDNAGRALILLPAPTNRATDAVDGTYAIRPVPRRRLAARDAVFASFAAGG